MTIALNARTVDDGCDRDVAHKRQNAVINDTSATQQIATTTTTTNKKQSQKHDEIVQNTAHENRVCE